MSSKSMIAAFLAAIMALSGAVLALGTYSDAAGEDLQGYGTANEIDIMPGYTWSYTSRFAEDLTEGMVLSFKVNELGENATIGTGQAKHQLTISIPIGFTPGKYNVVLMAEHAASGQTEDNGRAAYQWIRVTVNNDLSLSYTDCINQIIAGASQEINLVSEGGIGDYTWVSKQMPAGLTLVGDKVTGVPTTIGLNTVVVTATPEQAGVESKDLTIEFTVFNKIIGGNAETIVSLGSDSSDSSAPIVQAGDDLDVTWEVSNGTLPAGFTLNESTGVVSGAYTGTDHGSVTVTITGTANNGPAQTATKQIVINYEPKMTLSGSDKLVTYTGNGTDKTLAVTPSVETSAVTWSVTTLTGVSVADGTVTVKGTAAVTNGTDVTVTASTQYGQKATHTFQLIVEDTLTIDGPRVLGTSAGIAASTTAYTITGGSGNEVSITNDGGYGSAVSYDSEDNTLSVSYPSKHDAGTVTLTVESDGGQTATIDVVVTVYSSIGFDSAPTAEGFYTYMND